MRFESFEVRNYKGIAFARLDGLSTESVVTISGRNGTGKSLLLEALVGAWTRRYQMPPRVGPWGDELVISMTMHLTEDEWAEVDRWNIRFHGEKASRDDTLTLELTASRAGSQSFRQDSAVLRILQNQQFQRDAKFGVLDFLPANRLVPAKPTATVDLGMLNAERVEQERIQMLDQFINSRAPMSLPSVSSYLVTLDYHALLATRQNLDVSNEYERLAAAFLAATGKTLLQPDYDPARGSNIEVELPTGQRHGLADLSSGEQEMLAMMYFVRRLSASGGVLCIDEPEQHLHPTLQAALFESMQDLAQRAQVLVVSHSVNLIAAAPLSGLVQVIAPSDEEINQVMRLDDHPGRVELVAALGVTPADLFQSDMLLVVEGDTDAQWLRALFPVETGRAHIMVAGSMRQVIDAHQTMEKMPAGIPWLCLCDRDLMTEEEVEQLKLRYPALHVWPQRAIESLLLHPPLISAVMRSLGASDTGNEEEVGRWLIEAAEPLKEEVLAQLVRRELSRIFPPPSVPEDGDRYQKMEREMHDYAAVNSSRAGALQSTLNEQRLKLDERWADDWATLVDPKPILAQVSARIGSFKSAAAFTSALIARAREDQAVRPVGLETFRVRMAAVLGRGTGVSS